MYVDIFYIAIVFIDDLPMARYKKARLNREINVIDKQVPVTPGVPKTEKCSNLNLISRISEVGSSYVRKNHREIGGVKKKKKKKAKSKKQKAKNQIIEPTMAPVVCG